MTVRAMHWRVVAERLWTPEIQALYHMPTPRGTAKEMAAAYKARSAATDIHRILFEDD